MPSLSAIVPATNDPPTLSTCTRAIEAALDPPEEIIVVRDPELVGPAAARNEGAKRASGDVLVFVDGDVVVHEDAFVRIRAAFESDAHVAAVFGSYDDSPTGDGVVSEFRNLLHHFVHQSSPGEVQTFWAGLGAIKRDVFLAAGGFDSERYRLPSIEDIELGMRLSAAGRRIVLDPELQGTHLKRWSFRQMVLTDLLRRGVPWVTLLLERRGEASTVLNLGWRHRLSAGLSLLATFAVAMRRPYLGALAAAGLVVANRRFYGLLWRRAGAQRTAAGVALHAVHHVTAVVSVPVALVAHALRSARGSEGRS